MCKFLVLCALFFNKYVSETEECSGQDLNTMSGKKILQNVNINGFTQ